MYSRFVHHLRARDKYMYMDVQTCAQTKFNTLDRLGCDVYSTAIWLPTAPSEVWMQLVQTHSLQSTHDDRGVKKMSSAKASFRERKAVEITLSHKEWKT